MKVDRGSFLVLVGMVASQACVVTNTDSNEERTTDPDGQSNTGGTGGSTASGDAGSNAADAGAAGTAGMFAGEGGTPSGEGGTGASGQGEAGSATDDGTAGLQETGSAGASDGTAGADDGSGTAGASGASGTAGAGDGSGTAGAGGGSGTAGAGNDSACDDSEGTASDCSLINNVSDCLPFYVEYCQSAASLLKPRLAEAATQCMVERDTCFPAADSGDPGPYDCMRNALAEGCSDPTADPLCQQVAQNCDSMEVVSDDECHRMVDGLTEQGRSQIETCVTDGCPYGLWSCVEGLSAE